MGRLTRFERAHHGATIRCVNHFTTTAMCSIILTKNAFFVNCFVKNCASGVVCVEENMRIKEMNEQSRPREKALRFGISALSDTELVALILQSGTRNRSVFDIAQDVLNKTEGLYRMMDLSIIDLMKIPGIHKVKALQLQASMELSRRILQAKAYQTRIQRPEDLAEWFMMTFGPRKQEHFIAVYLDTKGKILSHRILYIGTLNESCVHPRDIFKEAYLENAQSVILVHNHPSGDVMPSQQDIVCTNQIRNVAKMMGIQLLDHIIVSRNSYYSLKQGQYLD